jgi:hypothetical protein
VDQTFEIRILSIIPMILPTSQMRLHTTQHGAVEDNLYLVKAGLDHQGGRNCRVVGVWALQLFNINVDLGVGRNREFAFFL